MVLFLNGGQILVWRRIEEIRKKQRHEGGKSWITLFIVLSILVPLQLAQRDSFLGEIDEPSLLFKWCLRSSMKIKNLCSNLRYFLFEFTVDYLD